MDFEKLPEEITNDGLLREMWDKLVHPKITEFEIAKQVVVELRPPTQDEVSELIDESEEPSVVAMREELEAAEDTVTRLTEELVKWATNTLTVPSTPDETLAAKQLVNRLRSQLTANLQSMQSHAAQIKFENAATFLGELLEEIATKPSNPRPVSSDTNEIREWAKAQGIKVSDRGRIPAGVREKWENRDAE